MSRSTNADLTSNQHFCNERNRVLRDLRAMAARERRWLLSDPDNEDRAGFLGALAWAVQHIDGLPEHWIAVDAPTRKPSDCLHEHASITCTDCGIDFRNALIRPDETSAPLGERIAPQSPAMPDGGSPSIPRGARQDFKNFHRLLCERFGYVHDEKDWERDQLSLIEHIAKRGAVETTSRPTPEQLGERWADTLKALANGESPEKASEPLRRCVGCGATSGFTSPLNLCQTCEAAMQKGNQ